MWIIIFFQNLTSTYEDKKERPKFLSILSLNILITFYELIKNNYLYRFGIWPDSSKEKEQLKV